MVNRAALIETTMDLIGFAQAVSDSEVTSDELPEFILRLCDTGFEPSAAVRELVTATQRSGKSMCSACIGRMAHSRIVELWTDPASHRELMSHYLQDLMENKPDHDPTRDIRVQPDVAGEPE